MWAVRGANRFSWVNTRLSIDLVANVSAADPDLVLPRSDYERTRHVSEMSFEWEIRVELDLRHCGGSAVLLRAPVS
jgi:hypothetical protein